MKQYIIYEKATNLKLDVIQVYNNENLKDIVLLWLDGAPKSWIYII